MNIHIPAEMAAFVAQEMKSGSYASEQEVVNAALEMLRREREEALAGIREGLADADAGRVQPLSEVMAELRAEYGISDDE